MWQIFLTGLGTAAGLIIAIGAQNAYVLSQGLKKEHVGLVVACCILSDYALILAGVAGMGALVQRHPVLLEVLRFGGAAFLLSYAFLAARRAWQGGAAMLTRQTQPQSARRVLAACLAFTYLNPHVYLDTVVLLGGISTQFAGTSRWVFAAGAGAASTLWFLSLGFGARALRPFFATARAWRLLDSLIALVMAALGGLLLLHPLA